MTQMNRIRRDRAYYAAEARRVAEVDYLLDVVMNTAALSAAFDSYFNGTEVTT